MSDYTPDTGSVRSAYTRAMRQSFVASTGEHIEEFDRWLAEHDRKLALDAWDAGFDAGFAHADSDEIESSPFANPYLKEPTA